MKVNLTELENTVLYNLFKSAEGNGHDFGFVEDAGIDPKIARGVISSLIKKGIIETWGREWNGREYYTQFTWKKNPGNVNRIESLADVI